MQAKEKARLQLGLTVNVLCGVALVAAGKITDVAKSKGGFVGSECNEGMGKDGKIINETEDNANNFWVSRASDWIHPLKGGYTLDPTTGARYFGAPRSNGKRAHAGIDLIAEPGKF